jgi:carbon monoxide dehydrogenase subunit G
MVRFSGEERFPVPRSRAAAKFADASFLASCAPDAEIVSVDAVTATWRAKSRFSFVTAKIETVLTITEQLPDALSFTLANRMPGATLGVNGTLAFSDSTDGTLVSWSAEIVSRTGLLKVVPVSVLRTQIQAELADLWRGVREKLSS